MPIFSRLAFAVVQWRSRRGLLRGEEATADGSAAKENAKRRGVRGETYAYWYLRRHGYVFVARNYVPSGAQGEIDLVGYDGETLVFVEVRTRTLHERAAAPAELSVTHEKQRVVARTARRFLLERHVKPCPLRFDVLAIEERPGHPPTTRLHKSAFRADV